MALVAPFFFVLVMGMVEFARMVMVQQALTNAAREGCRKAALPTTSSTTVVDATVRQQLKPSLSNAENTSTCRVTITPTVLAGIAENTEISVAVEVNYTDVTWLPPAFLKKSVLRGKATVRRE
jgi:Flp pilus assembly protein TadG